MASIFRKIYEYLFVEYRYRFNVDLGVGLIGKDLFKRIIKDSSGIIDHLVVKYDSTRRIYYISFDIKRPEEKVNKLRQRINLIKVLRMNLDLLTYRNREVILNSNFIKIDRLGYGKILGETSMDIRFYDDRINVMMLNADLLNRNGDYEIVLKDYENNKKVIEM